LDKDCKKIQNRIHLLINETTSDLFNGIGKLEALKHSISGLWSRKINDEHKMVYKVNDPNLYIILLRYHY